MYLAADPGRGAAGLSAYQPTKRTILLALLFLVCCLAGFAVVWLVHGALGGWVAVVALGWVVLVSKGFAVGLALRGVDR